MAFLTVVTIVFGIVIVYPTLRLTTLAGLSPPVGLAPLLFSLPFLTRWLTETVHEGWSRRLAAIVMTYIGASFIAFVLLIPAEVLMLLLPAHRLIGDSVLALTLILTVYGIVNAQRLNVTTLDVNAGPQARGTTLVQISDVHIGSRQPGLLRGVVDRANGLEPDFVLITGDLIDMRGIGHEDLTAIRDITAPCYYCIGNHERYVDLEPICSRLTDLGVRVSRNASEAVKPLQFIGVDDAESRTQVATHLPRLQALPDHYRILLYHRPDGLADAAAWGVDLMLTGHTHRGQIFPFYYLVKRVFPNIYGRYKEASTTLYVSPGTGTWGPVMRLGSRCEITLIRLL